MVIRHEFRLLKALRRIRWSHLGLGVAFSVAVWGFSAIAPFAAWDPAYYMGQASSLVEDGDLDLRNDLMFAEVTPAMLLRMLCWTDPQGRLRTDFPVGPALFESPFYVLGRVLDPPGTPAARWSRGQRLAAWLGSLGLAAGLLWCLWRWLARLGLAGPERGLGAAALFLGTPLALHAVNLHTGSHALSTLAVFGVVAASLRLAREPGSWTGLVAGAASGVCVLMRWQDAVVALVPLAALAMAARSTPSRGRVWMAAAAVAAAAATVLATQGWIWLLQRERLLWVPQGSDFMSWSRPEVVNLLFAQVSGTALWAPVLLAGFCGLLLPWRCPLPGAWRWVFLAVAAAGLYVSAAAAADWWGGAAYGPRRLTSLVPFAAAGVANGLHWAKQATAARRAASLFLLLCCAWALVTMHLFLTNVRDLSVLVAGGPSRHASLLEEGVVLDQRTALERLSRLPERLEGSLSLSRGRWYSGLLSWSGLVLAIAVAGGAGWLLFERTPRKLLEAGAVGSVLAVVCLVQMQTLQQGRGDSEKAARWQARCDAASGTDRGFAMKQHLPTPAPAAAAYLAGIESWRRGQRQEALESLLPLGGRGFPAVEALLDRDEALAARGRRLKVFVPGPLQGWRRRGRPAAGGSFELPPGEDGKLSFDLRLAPPSPQRFSGLLRLFRDGRAAARLYLDGDRIILEGERRVEALLPASGGWLPVEVGAAADGGIQVTVGSVRLESRLGGEDDAAIPATLRIVLGGFGYRHRRRLAAALALRDLEVTTTAASDEVRAAVETQHPAAGGSSELAKSDQRSRVSGWVRGSPGPS